MIKVVNTRTKYINGLKTDIDVTCCDKARRLIASLLELEKVVSDIFDYYAVIFNKEVSFTMNYCPTCGGKLEKEDRGKQ